MVWVGVDVSKDRLDIHVLPQEIAFAVARDGKGLAELIERLAPLTPKTMATRLTRKTVAPPSRATGEDG